MDCFIRKNTPELREELKRSFVRWNDLDDNSGEWVAFNSGMCISVHKGHERLFPGHVDCGTDADLFIETIKKEEIQ